MSQATHPQSSWHFLELSELYPLDGSTIRRMQIGTEFREAGFLYRDGLASHAGTKNVKGAREVKKAIVSILRSRL